MVVLQSTHMIHGVPARFVGGITVDAGTKSDVLRALDWTISVGYYDDSGLGAPSQITITRGQSHRLLITVTDVHGCGTRLGWEPGLTYCWEDGNA